jgi:hypothetical protein
MDHDIEALKAEVRKLQKTEFYRAARDALNETLEIKS